MRRGGDGTGAADEGAAANDPLTVCANGRPGERALRRHRAPIGVRAVGQRFGEVQAAHVLFAVEVGEGAGHLEVD